MLIHERLKFTRISAWLDRRAVLDDDDLASAALAEFARYRSVLNEFEAHHESDRGFRPKGTAEQSLAMMLTYAKSRLVHGGGQAIKYEGLLERFADQRAKDPHADYFGAANSVARKYLAEDIIPDVSGPTPTLKEVRSKLHKYVRDYAPHLRPVKKSD